MKASLGSVVLDSSTPHPGRPSPIYDSPYPIAQRAWASQLGVAQRWRSGFDGAMGATKRYMELIESRGWRDLDTNICSECVLDTALCAAIQAHGASDQC